MGRVRPHWVKAKVGTRWRRQLGTGALPIPEERTHEPSKPCDWRNSPVGTFYNVW